MSLMSVVKPFKPADLKYLERLFVREIDDALSKSGAMLQSRAKRYRDLARMGYCYEAEEFFPSALGRIRCVGWRLTHKGRATYCQSCKDEPT